MNKFNDLYNFLELARNNRKYPENTANNLKSSLKIFEKELNADELNSLDLIEDSVEEIFQGVVKNNKDKSIGSLITYRARFFRVINDYKKYGREPEKIQNWILRPRQDLGRQAEKFTPLLIKKDKTDKNKIELSGTTHTPVHKIELSLQNSDKATLLIPKNINSKEIKLIKKVLDSLTAKN